MAENSKIEWCDHTANLWWGCTEVHEGCDNCYARVLDNRWKGNHWGNDLPRRAIKNVFNDLAKYQKLAEKAGKMHRVFVGSMMDIFEKPMPVEGWSFNTHHLRNELFENITNGKYPNLLFLLLTKRPSNINKYIPESWKANPPENVMFGTSLVNQQTADTLIPQLLNVKANGKFKVFLSIEPQLDSVDLTCALGINSNYYEDKDGAPYQIVDWVICGGESGQKKRPFNPDWARSLRDQCKAADIPFFMKQIDKVQPIPDDLMVREFPHKWVMFPSHQATYTP